MNADVKKLWIDALRSGEYKQGRATLTRVDSNGNVTHCCLGVLCELALRSGLALEVTSRLSFTDDSTLVMYDEEEATLPPRVAGWAGLPEANPVLATVKFSDLLPTETENDDVNVPLAGVNDRGVPFTDIADLIEEHL